MATALSDPALDSLVATHPALYSHKGTPVRFVFEMASGERHQMEPLRYHAGGIALDSEIANAYLPLAITRPAPFVVLGHDGSSVREQHVSGGTVEKVEVFVVYPNGSTWSGEIFAGRAPQLGLLVWSWELGRRLRVTDPARLFGLTLSWPDVPTTVGFVAEEAEAEGGCTHIQHSCKDDCNARSKLL